MECKVVNCRFNRDMKCCEQRVLAAAPENTSGIHLVMACERFMPGNDDLL